MSDEQPRGTQADTADALTGEVRDSLVVQPHGGAIRTNGNPRTTQPTPAETRAKSRKAYYTAIPKLSRIANNPAKKGKKPRYSTSEQIAAARVLAQYGNDDTISATDLRRALKGFSEAIVRKYPEQISEEILALAAPFFFSL